MNNISEYAPNLDAKKYRVKCLNPNCRQEVEVTFPYRREPDGFYTSTCPLCGKLAYNSRTEPSLA